MNTKPIIQIGLALILLGIATLTYQGASYNGYTSLHETNKLQTGNDRVISLPLAGGLLLGGGSLLVAFGVKKSARRR